MKRKILYFFCVLAFFSVSVSLLTKQPQANEEERPAWYRNIPEFRRLSPNIATYGKVIDQNEDPIVEASVKISWGTFPTLDPLFKVVKNDWLITDGNGEFQFTRQEYQKPLKGVENIGDFSNKNS